MAKIKYYYDTESCKYIRVKTSTGDIFLNALGIFSLTLSMAVGLIFLYSNYFESPKDVIRMNEIKNLELAFRQRTGDFPTPSPYIRALS